jgi:hypothetical protein
LTHVEHEASAGLLRRMGFREEGIRRERGYRKGSSAICGDSLCCVEIGRSRESGAGWARQTRGCPRFRPEARRPGRAGEPTPLVKRRQQ